MRERKTGRLLALLLVAALLLSLLPATVLAVDTDAVTTRNNDLMRIVHLDCGRKYFTVEWVERLIDEMAKNGYTHLELAFGNDGLRFLLDDMDIDTDGDGTANYQSDAVKAAIQNGNKDYYNAGATNEWSEAEMTQIIDYAEENGISIIPLLNTPGHMDAIVYAMGQLGISDAAFKPYDTASVRTVSLTSDQAVAFTQALVKKYVDYFAKQGCKYFNLGADEYANDVLRNYSGMGFGYLVNQNQYGTFVEYINTLARYVIDNRMTPIVFNDGVCYNNKTDSGLIDTEVLVSYWSCGWNGYDVASASFLRGQGYSLINTHGNFYYVLKSNQSSDPDMWHNSTDNATDAASWDNNTFMARDGQPTISDPVGSMFCIWCDEPDVESEETIAQNVIDGGILYNMAVAMDSPKTTPPTGSSDGVPITLTVGQNRAIEVDGQVEYTGTGDSVASASVKVNEHNNTAPSTWQRISSLDELESGKKYVIANFDKALKNNRETQHSISTASDTLVTTPSVDIQFVIEASGDYYTLRGVENEQYLYPYAEPGLGWYYSLKQSYDQHQVAITDESNSQFKIAYPGTISQWLYEDTTSKINVESNKNFGASKNGNALYLYKEIPGKTTTTYTSTITFTGKSVGTTSLEIGGVTYDITVIAEDLSKVTPLTVEYWITNKRVTANNGTQMTIFAQQAYGEDGVEIAELVPTTGTTEGNQTDYWKSTKLDEQNKQTTGGGVDQTLNGYDFTYVRYYNGNWAVSSDGSKWETVLDTDQIVAYYLQRTDVTDEVTTQVVDWGPKKANWGDLDYLGSDYVLLDFSVKYESSEEVPSRFPTENSLGFHCENMKVRTLGMIRALETAEYEVYMITVTPTSDHENDRLRGSTAADNRSYSYRGTEKVAWAATQTDLDNSDLGTYRSITGKFTYSVGGDPIVSGLEIYRAHGMKVTYYVRAKATPDSLTVNYVDLIDNTTFYTYNIAVKQGMTFDPQFALEQDGTLVHNTVTNSLGNTQTVSTDLSTLSQIGAQYLNSKYECRSVELSGDYKTVTLYYHFDYTHSFVVDFGLPLVITAEDLGIKESALTDATVNVTTGGGTASIANSQITFTPNKVLTGRETINLTMYDADEPYSHQIYIYPASNVLYEETFFGVTTDYSVPAYHQKEWTATSATFIPTQSAAQNTLYGYDTAYSSSTGDSLGSKLTVNALTSAVGSEILATTFYGNGFDLIGTAGPDTGYVYLLLGKHDADGTIASVDAIVIDTSYVQKDDNNEYITLHQVPLAHKEYEEDATYTAYVYASYRAAREETSTQQARASTFSLMSASSPLDEIYAVLAEFEAAGLVINDIEFVSVDENSVLSESADAQVSLFSVPATGSDTDTTAAKSAPARPAGTTVTIDGFRVYRKAIDSNFAAAYARAGEDKFKYINILDAVLNPDGNNENFESFAYVEGGATGYTQADYEKSGGPQNELYLKAGRGVVIKVGGQGAAQFSARAVTGSCDFSVLVDGFDAKPYTANHNTELYYAAPDTGVITVVNNSKTDMLALGNLKILGDATVSTLSAEDVRAACLMLASAFPVDPGDIEEPEVPVEPETPAVFEPAKLDVKVNSTKVLFNKLVTVTVSASADVDNLTINGKTLYPTNSLLVQWGLSKTYTYIYVDTVKRTESKSYEIVAYNDAGLASAPVTVWG